MRTRALIAAASALALAACGPEAGSSYENEAAETVEDTALTEVLADTRRDEDRVRDEFRNPAETLGFFRVAPDQTILEYAPGGGWYTRILAPYTAENGGYVAVGFDPDNIAALPENFRIQVREGGENFAANQSEALGIAAEKLPFHFGNEVPDALDGTVDRVLIIRIMHNLIRWGIAESEIAALRETMKPDAPDEYADGNMGYLKRDDLVAFFEVNGFELVEESEINANPADTADYENGVWTLPPSYGLGDQDRETYAAIGESDRMTLLFKLAE